MTDPQAVDRLDDEPDDQLVVPPGTPLRVLEWLGPALLLLAGAVALLVWASGTVWRAPANGGLVATSGLLGLGAAVAVGLTGAAAYRDLTVAATARYRTVVFVSALVLGVAGLTVLTTAAGVFVILAGLSAAGSDRPVVRALRERVARRRTAVLISTGIVGALGLVARPLVFHAGLGLGVAETVIAASAGFLFGFAFPRKPD